MKIDSALLSNALTYTAYRALINDLNGANSLGYDEHMVHYAQLNDSRMNRLDKTQQLEPAWEVFRKGHPQKMSWVVLTELWCGDAAQIVPVLAAMANAVEGIDLKILLRDQHPDLMDHFLTNGGRAIPKLLFVDADTNEVLADWGPRPTALQNWVRAEVTRIKTLPETERAEASEAMKIQTQKWYNSDKGKTIQSEVMEQMRQLVAPVISS